MGSCNLTLGFKQNELAVWELLEFDCVCSSSNDNGLHVLRQAEESLPYVCKRGLFYDFIFLCFKYFFLWGG